ncbi:FMN-dependent NADH-azoreductase [Hymenobacter psoromatis]|nr:FMN-dependent NADH-azoreductase [Hymenobacter psoromatis]
MHILQVISSPRAGASFSKKLGQGITEKLQAAYPGSTVQVRDLATHPFPHLEEAKLNALFTPAEKRTPEQHEAAKHSDDAIAEVMAADVLVIEAPLYNFGIPSTLKAWIDHIVRAGQTFRYVDGRPEGLIKGKKMYVAMASGAVYSEGPYAAYDFVAPYLKAVFGFVGFADIEVVRVEGTSMPGVQDTALEKALASVHIGATATA